MTKQKTEKILKQVQNDKSVETGRSMTEMLGVLAVIGVLSVGSIAGYRYAMNKYRSNDVLMGVSERAVLVASQIASGKEASIKEFEQHKETAGGTIESVEEYDDGGFSLVVTGVKGPVCENILNDVDERELSLANDDEDLTKFTECDNENDNTILFVYGKGSLLSCAAYEGTSPSYTGGVAGKASDGITECRCPEGQVYTDNGECVADDTAFCVENSLGFLYNAQSGEYIFDPETCGCAEGFELCYEGSQACCSRNPGEEGLVYASYTSWDEIPEHLEMSIWEDLGTSFYYGWSAQHFNYYPEGCNDEMMRLLGLDYPGYCCNGRTYYYASWSWDSDVPTLFWNEGSPDPNLCGCGEATMVQVTDEWGGTYYDCCSEDNPGYTEGVLNGSRYHPECVTCPEGYTATTYSGDFSSYYDFGDGYGDPESKELMQTVCCSYNEPGKAIIDGTEQWYPMVCGCPSGSTFGEYGGSPTTVCCMDDNRPYGIFGLGDGVASDYRIFSRNDVCGCPDNFPEYPNDEYGCCSLDGYRVDYQQSTPYLGALGCPGCPSGTTPVQAEYESLCCDALGRRVVDYDYDGEFEYIEDSNCPATTL